MSRRTEGAKRASFLVALCALIVTSGASAGSLSFPGTNVGAIPDGAGTGPRNYGAPRDIRFVVTGVTGTLTGAGVQFAADHPFVGDLKVSLIAPTGVEHLVFESTGATTPTGAGSAANLVSANPQTFIENGSNWWTNAGLADANIPTSTSRSVVAGPVAVPPPAVTSFNTAFLNQPANGTWILRFQDGWSGDVGSVTSANLLLLSNFATRTVTKLADTNDTLCDADCSLREAIAVAAPGDLVSFASPFFDTPRAIVLGGDDLLINKALAIVGPGAHRLTVSGNNQSRIFLIDTTANVTLSGLRMTDGDGTGALVNGPGGAIYTDGAGLVVHACDISGNRSFAGGNGGAIYAGGSGRLSVYDSSISNNSTGSAAVSDTAGLLIDAPGPNRLERVTISGNAPSIGSFGLGASVPVTVVGCTITGNGRGIVSYGASTALQNSVIGANSSGDLTADGGSFSSLGHNLIGNPGAIAVFTQPGDQAGTLASPLDPRLGPFSHNGGTVPVHAPLQGSPLLDKGKAIGSDARGVVRAFDLAIAPATGGNNADIGAVEVAPQVVINTDDAGTGSLRQAIADAPVAPAVSDIWFDPLLTVAPATITLTSGQLSIDRNLAIHGPGAQRLAISGNRQSRVIGVQANRRVGLSGLTFTDGNGVGSQFSGEGGAILNAAGAHLTVARSVVQNSEGGFGGGIRNRDAAAMVVRESTLKENLSFAGGGVDSGTDAELLLEASTVSGNQGGGVRLFSGRATLIDTTITGNRDTNVAGGLIVRNGGSARVRNTLIAANSTGQTANDTGTINGGVVQSRGHNLIGNPDTVTGFTQPSDQTGNAANPLDPKLSPLAIHSGQVPTHMPLGNSPALDKGLRYGRDQRGLNGAFDIGTIDPAIGGNNADIGAVEAQAIIVTQLVDSGPGSLRQAILDANANGPGTDDVLFNFGLPGIIVHQLSSKLPLPTGHLNLDGAGANRFIIRRNDAAPAFGLLDIFAPVQIGITGLSLSNGLDNGSNGGDNFGGAIDALGAELHLTGVEISGNQSGSGAGLSLANADGVITDSAIASNVAGTQGGGIYFQGDNNRLIVRGSTIGSNAANGSGLGGGIAHVGVSSATSRSVLEVSSSTIASNSGAAGGGIRTASASATSISVTSLQSTLLANNTGGNLLLVTGTGPGNVNSRGYNLSNTVEPLLNPATDRINVNPQLGPLQNNGGATRTFALLAGSAAIDGGIRTGGFLDQRGVGFARTIDLSPANAVGGDGTDIGAFEVQTEPVVPPMVVSIVRASANPAAPSTQVNYTVTFSSAVVASSVFAGNFVITATGTANATIVDINGSGTSYAVTLSLGSGQGSVRLDLIDDDSIVNSSGVPLGGVGAGNGSFTTGEVYTVGTLPEIIFQNGFQ